MKSLLHDIKEFVRSDFSIYKYVLTFALLTAALWFNYSSGFYWHAINVRVSSIEKVFRFFIFFSVPWFIIAIPGLLLNRNAAILKNKGFWISILAILLFMSIDSASILLKSFLKYASTSEERLFIIKVINNLQGILLMSIFTCLIFIFRKNTRFSDIGLKFRGIGLSAYLILIAGIIPMIIWASFNKSFLAAYPGYKPWLMSELFGLQKPLTAIIYEFSYGIDFISVEFVFRGLLVMLMSAYIGKDAVLPMAAVYCFLHFGKPEAEAISSFFGGYLLGIIALKTRSILPGIILHLTLAYMMDLASYIQHYLK